MDIEVLAPRSVRSQLITLALANPLVTPQAFVAIDISVALSGQALLSGLALPLQLSVTAPSSSINGTPVYQHTFRRSIPSLISYRPREGGQHIILLRELTHMRWWGALSLNVAGDPLDVPD